MTLPLGNSQTDLNEPGPSPVIELDVIEIDNDADQLAKLPQFGWQVGTQGWLYFPVIRINTHFNNRLVTHKYPDLDAARIENTGRDPVVVDLTAIFVNTITPGPKESWVVGSLYPFVYDKVMNAALSRETGTVQHPEIGQFSAKLQFAHTTLNADFRGGAMVDMQFIETIPQSDILLTVGTGGPITQASANSLDQAFAQLSPSQIAQLNLTPSTVPSFSGQLTAITNAQTDLGAIGAISQALFTIDTILTAIDVANNVYFAYIKNLLVVFYSTILDLQAQFGNTLRSTIATYVTQTPQTLAGIAQTLKVALGDLFQLNPSLFNRPIIPAYTPVKYFR